MNKVWVVLEPTYCGYCDFNIVAVYDSKEKAEKELKTNANFKVEEWEVL